MAISFSASTKVAANSSSGCPVACSYSSGIPEAGGDAAFYFDPTSLPSFEQTLLGALRQLRRERTAIRAASRRQALRFTWHDFARRIDEAIARTAAENAGSHPS